MAFESVTVPSENIYRISEPIAAFAPQFGVKVVNLFLVVGKERAALIDTGMGVGDLRAEIALNAIEIELFVIEPDMSAHRNTMQKPEVRAALPPEFHGELHCIIRKPIMPCARDGDALDLGSRTLTAVHTPGQSPGHTAFFDETSGALLTADAAHCRPMLKAAQCPCALRVAIRAHLPPARDD